jgi:PAS domain S-box-containing protein
VEGEPEAQAAAATRARLGAAMRFASAGAWEFGLAEDRILWRVNIEGLLGLEPGSLPNELSAFLERVHPADRSALLDILDRARARSQAGEVGDAALGQYRVVWPDGSVRWLDARCAITERGTLEGVIVDVTDRHETEELARYRHEQLSAVLSASPDAILIVDRDARLDFASDATINLVGCPPEELVGRDLHDLIEDFVAGDEETAHTIAGELLAGAVEERSVQLRMRRPDGEPFVSEHHVRVTRDSAGDPDGFVDVVRDVTERLREEQELIEARDAAEAGERAKSRFLARTSHELRTPMNAVLGFAQLLDMEEELSPEARASVEHILRAGRHLLTLLDDVLDLSRVGSGEVHPYLAPVDVAGVVTDSVALVASRADERSIQVTTTASAAPVVAQADEQRLRQVLVNLLLNAVTYNHDGGHVGVSWHADDHTVHIDVRDTGYGVLEDDLERLFEPFDRLDAEARGLPGTGLGLALSRALVEAMGGRIDVVSTPGHGSTFSVTLRRAPSTSASATVPPVSVGTATRGRVAYIDDNPANLVLVRRSLTATDARGGLKLVRRELPELVLLDVNLPDAAGDEVLAELQRNPVTSAIPVVVLSSDPSPRVEQRLRRNGVTDFLTKPLDVPALLQAIDRAVPDAGAATGHGAAGGT